MRKFGIFALVIAVGLGASGCVDRKAQAAAKETATIVNDPVREVAVTPVLVQDIQDLIEINGEIATSEDAQISAQSSGKISAVFVKEGDVVSTGQVVATLDSENLQNQVSQARAGLSSALAQLSQAKSNAALTPSRSEAAVKQAEAALRGAKAGLQKALNGSRTEERQQAENNVASAKSNYETARKNLDRTRKLVKEGALAESQLDTAQTSFDTAATQYENSVEALKLVQNSVRQEDIEAAREQVRQAEQGVESAKASKKLDVTLGDQVSAAQAQVQSARAQVAVAEKNLREASVRSPFSGRVYGKPLQAGVVVSPGTPIARVVGGSGVYFDGQVPSDKMARVEVGTLVSISVDALAGKTFTGHVVAVSPQGDNVGRLFNIRIQFDNASNLIKPGMFAKGQVQLGEVKGAMLIDQGSILTREGQKYVMVAEGDKAKKVNITTGIRQDSKVEVHGLTNTAKVISRGQDGLVDGSKIKVEADNKGA
ncbi:MAG: efflux RND transporter periplasmic adaptor subunit [Armatimonadetes bacterium]|nr:efflux RND transporter periplasmic adaptor subunit [Armatimonadota bacterium]